MDDLNEFCEANKLFKTTLLTIGEVTIPPENFPCFDFLVLLAIIVFLLLLILIIYCCCRCRMKKRWGKFGSSYKFVVSKNKDLLYVRFQLSKKDLFHLAFSTSIVNLAIEYPTLGPWGVSKIALTKILSKDLFWHNQRAKGSSTISFLSWIVLQTHFQYVKVLCEMEFPSNLNIWIKHIISLSIFATQVTF